MGRSSKAITARKHRKRKKVKFDGPTEQPTDRPTDEAGCSVACTRLDIFKNRIYSKQSRVRMRMSGPLHRASLRKGLSSGASTVRCHLCCRRQFQSVGSFRRHRLHEDVDELQRGAGVCRQHRQVAQRRLGNVQSRICTIRDFRGSSAENIIISIAADEESR